MIFANVWLIFMSCMFCVLTKCSEMKRFGGFFITGISLFPGTKTHADDSKYKINKQKKYHQYHQSSAELFQNFTTILISL